jgi:hypothetical protein
VGKEGYIDMRGLIWERMAHDFNPELFGGEKKLDLSPKDTQNLCIYYVKIQKHC